MGSAAANYTTYLRTELDPVTRQSYSTLQNMARDTYRQIGQYAEEAGLSVAQAIGGPKAGASLRSYQNQANTTLGAIRREANATATAIGVAQIKMSGLRASAISSAAQGGGSAQIAVSRATAAANDNLVRSNARVAASASQTGLRLASQSAGTRKLADDTSRLSRSLDGLGSTLAVVQGPLGPISGRISAISSAITTLGTGTLLLAGAATALFAFAAVGNVYATVESRLRPLYETQTQVNGAMRETGRIAIETRASLGATADLYAKLTAAGRDYNLTRMQVSRTTELASKAATISGGNAVSRDAGLYQFSQGLASGKLGGDELRSVLENIPELARAIAAGFKNVDGSIGTTLGNLRKLGADGALSTTAVVEALGRSGDILDAKFAKLPVTISSAKNELITTFTLLIGQVDKAAGVTNSLAQGISAITHNLDLLLAVAAGLATRFVLPKLGGFLGDMRAAIALRQQLNREIIAGTAAGTVTPLTPTGIGRAKAFNDFGNAAAIRNQAAATVAAQEQVIAALDKEALAVRATGAAEIDKMRTVQAGSAAAIEAAQLRSNALRTELAQIVENRAAYEAQVAGYNRARALLVANPNNNAPAVQQRFVQEHDAQAAAARLNLAKANVQATATAGRLAEAEIALAGAMQASSASMVTNTTIANANGQRGFALLAIAEQRILATQALAAATAELSAAESLLAQSEVRLTAAQLAFNAAGTLMARTLTGIGTVARGLVTVLGGPLNAAITLVAGALIYLSMQSDAALDSLHNFAGGQDELYRRLGLTTEKIREQTDAYREQTLAIANNRLAKAQETERDSGKSLANSLGSVRNRLKYTGGSPEDVQRLDALISGLERGGRVNESGVGFLSRLQNQNPGAFKDNATGPIDRLFGRSAGQAGDKLLGVQAARLEAQDARQQLEEVKKALAAPRTTVKPAVPLTLAQLTEQASKRANDLDLTDSVEASKRKRDNALGAVMKNKDLTDSERLEKATDIIGTYNREIKAIDARNAALAKREGRAATAEQNKLLREQEEAARKAARAAETLADIQARYDAAPSMVDRALDDVRKLDALVGQQVAVKNDQGEVTGTRTFTDADRLKEIQSIAEGLRRPFADVTREYERQAEVQALLLQGRTAEAAALEKAYSIIDRVGGLEEGQYQNLVRMAGAQEDMNRRLEERGRIVSTLSGAVNDVKQVAESFLNELPSGVGKAGTKALSSLLTSFRATGNKLLVEQLFGGVQKRIDDLISGKTALANATEFTAQQATRTGGIIQSFGTTVQSVIDFVKGQVSGSETGISLPRVGDAPITGAIPASILGSIIPKGGNLINHVQDAANALGISTGKAESKMDDAGDAAGGLAASLRAASASIAIAASSLAGGAPVGGVAMGADGSAVAIVGGLISRLGDTLTSSMSKDTGAASYDAEGNIVVTAKSRAAPPVAVAAQIQRPPTLREIYNETGKSIGEKIDKSLGTNFAKTLGGKVGDALAGASMGTTASGLFGAITGVKQSEAGAAIGGALGKFIPIPGGDIIGGIIGGTIGGLLKKIKFSTAQISLNQFGEAVGGQGSGRGGDEIKAATGAASSVASGVNAIADQLGAKIDQLPAVTVGMWDGKYRVALTNTTKPLHSNNFGSDILKDFGQDQGAAIEYAVRYVLGNAVVTGISQASQRILKSGQDLQRAIEKALLIESVPKRLLAMTDPVRAAVTDLNTEFQHIIDALNEGGATAEQYAQAQQLYDLERARTIAEAQKAASSAIQNYLDEMNAGSSSPLNKATVYQNAKGNLDKLNADVQAGKFVDQDDLVQAAKNFQDASRGLFGSSQDFFTDFDMLEAILRKAVVNTGVIDSSGSGTLPGSPFTSQAVQDAIGNGASAQIGAINNQTDTLNETLQAILSAIVTDRGFSGINDLPGFIDRVLGKTG